MIKSKKIFTVLSTAAITGLLVAAVNSTAFAKTTAVSLANDSNCKVSTSNIKNSDFTVNKTDLLNKPIVISISLIDSETIHVKFNKEVDFKYAHDPSNYQLLDSNDKDISNHIKGIYNTVSESDTQNTDTYNIKVQKHNPNNKNEDWRLAGNKYTLNIKNIRDTASTPNIMDDYTFAINDDDTI